MHTGMENSTYILVPSAGAQQLQIPMATSSTNATFTKVNSGHSIVMSSANAANLTAGKSMLNVRAIGPNLVNSWKPGEATNRHTNTQTHPVRFIMANSKDGFVNVPNFASLTSGVRTQGVAVNPNSAASNGSGVSFVKHSSGGLVHKIAPAAATAANFSVPVPNGNLQATIPGGNKVPGRTTPVASFASNTAAVVPKTAGSATAMWASLSVANSTMAASSVTSTSPSKQLIIQLAPEQLVRCCCFVCFLLFTLYTICNANRPPYLHVHISLS